MPSANKTPVIGLNQWQGNEYIKRQDLNEDNLKIDNKIKDLQEEIDNIQVPVTKVNGRTGEVVLTAADLGAETPSGAQEKITTHEEKLNPHSQYALDSDLTSLSQSVALQMGEMAKKDGTVQVNLNSQKLNNKTAAQTPQTAEKTDIIGMINEVFNKKVIIKNEDTGINYCLKLDSNGLYLQEV